MLRRGAGVFCVAIRITMKTLLAFAFLVALPLAAQESKPLLLDKTPPVIAAPDFKQPLDGTFSVAKGKWTPENGVLSVLDLPEQKHIPVLHHKVGLSSAWIDVEFLIEKAGSFLVGCDSDKHVGRVVVNAAGFSLAEDSAKPSHTIATLPMPVKPGEWHQLHVEWQGDQLAARLDGRELRAQHPFLATPKGRSWLAAGPSVKVRNLKISGAASLAKP